MYLFGKESEEINKPTGFSSYLDRALLLSRPVDINNQQQHD